MPSSARALKRTARRRPAPPAGQSYSFYFPKEIDNSRLVKVPDPGEQRSQQRLVLVSLILAAMLLAAAYVRFANLREGYRLEQLKAQREQMLEANRELRLEEASLRDPGRIDVIARGQLGFGAPAPEQVVYLEKPGAEGDGTALARAAVPAIPRLKGSYPAVQ